MTKGAVEGLYFKHLLEQQGYTIEIVIRSDASAAIGAANRLGVGKRMKHLELQDLWIQQLIRNGILTIKKVSTRENWSDILTKYVSKDWLDKVMKQIGFRFPNEDYVGVDSTAPVVDEDSAEDELECEQWHEKWSYAIDQLRQHP